MDQIVTELSKLFSPKLIAAKVAALLPKLIVASIILLVFFIIWVIVRRTLTYVLEKANTDRTAQQFILTVAQYGLMTVAGVMALGQLGVDITSILASLGVVGLTIGFAAKDTLSNVISGLFIFWDRPFTLGDLIEIDGHYGRVENITVRSTRVVTPDGKMLAIPNTVIVNSTVASYTNFPNIRLDVDVTIGVQENVSEVRRILLEAIKADGSFMDTPEPQVVVSALNDYNVALQLRVWSAEERAHIPNRFALRELVYTTLTDAGVDMPFETVQLAPIEVTASTLPPKDAA